ncbi:MAG TPA: hypothetical protein VFW03_13785 [Gemmatimonadaceae bacterium]|nr:hypothetical protein [Gemmatimonadaceae bacterium]
MTLALITLFAQLAAVAPRQAAPVLAFPEPGLDDPAAYRGYQTRFFRDAAGNTLQVYLDSRTGRVVHLWADGENESIGFTVRSAGRPATLRWGGDSATVASTGGPRARRSLEYQIAANGSRVDLGLFLLGSMRVERDLQYSEKHLGPFVSPAFRLPEIEGMLARLERLDPAARSRHLALLGAEDVSTLRARLLPTVTTNTSDSVWTALIVQPSLDARDTLSLELRADATRLTASRAGDSISLRAKAGSQVRFSVRVSTTGKTLTPLTRQEIFTPAFLQFLAAVHDSGRAGGAAATRARWLEREVRGVELLSSHEKLMAGLPTYATYFGRDMLVSALMMRSIWRPEMSEFAVASALRKLSPTGQVSHEEALGGQAVREGAAEYTRLVDAHLKAAADGNRGAADSILDRAWVVLGDLRRTRENYHMIDDEFQLAVLAGRWLADSAVTAQHKREFLADSSDGGGSRLARLVRELGLVTRMTAAYAADPIPTNLVSFEPADSGRWSPASWRDSGAGYGGGLGRYAMDVNAIWAPHALESIGRILTAMASLGISVDSLAGTMPDLAPNAPLGRYARDAQALHQVVERWYGASAHFLVRLSPAQVRTKVTARVAALPADERRIWTGLLAATKADRDSLVFLALALDAGGKPIGVANSDPATRLFLGERETGVSLDPGSLAASLRDVRLFVRPYPVGLLIDRVGPVVANDAYATPAIWRAFSRDRYHSPYVVWGREVNLFLLGAAAHVSAAASRPAYAREVSAAIAKVRRTVEASGFRSELWSYAPRGDQVVAIRYGSGADVQLWSTTDLAVQFALSRLGR